MVNEIDKTRALLVFQTLLADKKFMSKGRRNDDTVDMLISCWVRSGGDNTRYGIMLEDVEQNFIRMEDWTYYLDHKDRIESYLEKWGPVDNVGKALGYLRRSYY